MKNRRKSIPEGEKVDRIRQIEGKKAKLRPKRSKKTDKRAQEASQERPRSAQELPKGTSPLIGTAEGALWGRAWRPRKEDLQSSKENIDIEGLKRVRGSNTPWAEGPANFPEVHPWNGHAALATNCGT